MARCRNCGKKGLFLKLSSSGLCMDCLEVAASAGIRTISMIKSGGEERKEALKMLDKISAEEMTSNAESDLENSPFNIWGIDIHKSADQIARIRRSEKVNISEYNSETKTAIIQGSKGHTYTTTFKNCTCGDFISRRLPCKHMYKLASEYGGVDFLKYL